jgi:phage terminase large subunit-like protein
VLHRPPFHRETAGREAVALAESVGLFLDPWQKLVVRVALAEDRRGSYAAREVGYLVSRQNGKGAILEAIALHGLFVVGDPLTLWTAHQFKTSSEAFLRMRSWIDGSDDLRRHVRRVTSGHGEECVELHTGQRLRFLARSKSSGRGFSPQRIIFDEAQEFSKVAAEAMLPSMRAQPNPQAIYTGTVPGPEINHPEHWRRLRDRGREGAPGRLAWLEWTPKGSDDPDTAAGIDLDDRRVWAGSNPGLGFRDGLDLESLAGDREGLADDSFAGECLSVWPKLPIIDMNAAFGAGRWQACAVEETTPPAPVAIGIAVAMDRAWSSIGAAGGTGKPHLGSVVRAPGTSWVAEEVQRIAAQHGCRVVLDDHGPASTLKVELDELGVEYTATTTAEYLDACARLFDLVQTGGIEHASYDDLDAAVGAAEKRAVGQRWAWSRKTGDTSMLEAVTLAFHGHSKPAKPEAKPWAVRT